MSHQRFDLDITPKPRGRCNTEFVPSRSRLWNGAPRVHFDWDLRRLATSFVIAARESGFKARTGSDAVGELTEAYRDHLRRFARMDTLEAWYWRLS